MKTYSKNNNAYIDGQASVFRKKHIEEIQEKCDSEEELIPENLNKHKQFAEHNNNNYGVRPKHRHKKKRHRKVVEDEIAKPGEQEKANVKVKEESESVVQEPQKKDETKQESEEVYTEEHNREENEEVADLVLVEPTKPVKKTETPESDPGWVPLSEIIKNSQTGKTKCLLLYFFHRLKMTTNQGQFKS